MKKTPQFRAGDRVTITRMPPNLEDRAGMNTLGVFRQALGKTYRVEGLNKHGHLELVVARRKPSPDTYEEDTIWIQPEYVSLARGGRVKR